MMHYEQVEYGRDRKRKRHRFEGKRLRRSDTRGDRSRHYDSNRGNQAAGSKGKKQKVNPPGRDRKPLVCFKCKSICHLIANCAHADEDGVINYVDDLAKQFGDVGLGIIEKSSDIGSDAGSNGSSDADDEFYESNYMEVVNDFLNERAGLHSMMGFNEALCTTKDAKYKGVCVDAGAQKSVAGKSQYYAYLNCAKAPSVNLKPANRPCKFGDSREMPLGIAPIRFPIDDEGNFFEFECIIVNAAIPILLGLDAAMQHGMSINCEDRSLSAERWKIPLVYKHGHLSREGLVDDILCTEEEGSY